MGEMPAQLTDEQLAELQRCADGLVEQGADGDLGTFARAIASLREEAERARAGRPASRARGVEMVSLRRQAESAVENGYLILPGGRQPIGDATNVAAAVAMIRPETIRVTAAGSTPLSGIIDSVSFIGDRQRLVVSGASNGLLTVDAPNTVQAKPGERIGLSIPPDAVRLLPPEN